jgi:hypothetical protein
MSTELSELERVIRDALHGGEITQAHLIHPTLRRPASRSFARLAAVTTAAAVVAGVAVLAAFLVVDRGESSHGPAGSDALAGVVGYRWQVTHLVDDHGPANVPGSLAAEIGFTRDGYLLGDDTLNPLQAKYTPTVDGYDARDVIVGGAGSVGPLDSIQARTRIAVDSLFFTTSSEPILVSPDLRVTVSVSDATLTLQRDGVELTLARVGVQPDFFAQPPSMTPTATLHH